MVGGGTFGGLLTNESGDVVGAYEGGSATLGAGGGASYFMGPSYTVIIPLEIAPDEKEGKTTR